MHRPLCVNSICFVYYIADCLASLHAQSCPHWRCLICDDKSTDDSIVRIQPWLSDKIQLLHNDQNHGVIYTLDRLIRAASTDIVGVLDADDALYPEATAQILDAYRRHPTVGFIYSNFTRYSADLSTSLGAGFGRSLPPGGTSLKWDCVSAIRTFRVAVYQRTAGITAAPRYAEDRDLVYKMEEVPPCSVSNRNSTNTGSYPIRRVMPRRRRKLQCRVIVKPI